jgi:ComF family protein
VWVRAQYQGVAKELIYRLKFARTKGSAQIVARLLGEALPTLPENTIVTYVPTATSRVRRRGYDQARVVATILSKERGLPCLPLLVRHGQDRQVGADRKQRIKQASGNYTVINNRKLQKAQVLLVDDILTTGATIEAAARVLKKAGARAVNAAIFAQKQ